MLFQLVLLIGASQMVSCHAKGVPVLRFHADAGDLCSSLRTQVLNATVPRIPDMVCVMALSNNLTATRTVDEGQADFAKSLASHTGLR